MLICEASLFSIDTAYTAMYKAILQDDSSHFSIWMCTVLINDVTERPLQLQYSLTKIEQVTAFSLLAFSGKQHDTTPVSISGKQHDATPVSIY